MRNFFRELDATLSNALAPVVKWIIYLCVGVFIISIVGGAFTMAVPAGIYHFFGASVSNTLQHFMLWQLVTYAFVHGGFGHLFFNLLALYFFGQRLEYRWGSSTFLRFCLIVGAGAVVTHLGVVSLLHVIDGRPLDPVIIGLSGVIYGIMIACAMYYPDDIVYFQFFIPIKLKYLVAIMGILTLISSTQGNSGIAHLTHLGGLLFGFLYVKFPRAFEWIPAPKNPFRKKPRYVDPRERWRKF